MRSGICRLEQALTAEATSMVKQAMSLAKRRGHAQVTPLHVASAMLSNPSGLLKKACLQCHSHPLQCKALELCFNVALNRLPASTPSHLLGPQYHNPSFSNALVAAFKRAQAHQRRGCVENQQQPILALKIELEQLVISILDDPSVSRVMREAGFSSTLVKHRVEQAVSLEICSKSTTTTTTTNNNTIVCTSSKLPKESSSKALGFSTSHVSKLSPPSSNRFSVSVSKPFDQIRHEDVMNVLNIMLNKKRNTVIVGESLVTAESVARGVMDKFERGLNSQGDYRYLQFITFPLFSLRNLNKEDVEQKLMELKCIVKSYMGRGVVLYLGDLTWISELWSTYYSEQKGMNNPTSFCMEQIVLEIKRLVCGVGDYGRLWLMGTSTFQTYMKCKTGQPSLETIWELHPLTIPVGNLSLSLNFDSDVQAEFSSKAHKDGSCRPLLLETGDQVSKQLNCCAECSSNFHKEVQYMQKTALHQKESSTVSSLPSWLQKYGEEKKRYNNRTATDQENIAVRDLCKKWNSFCSSVHKYPQNVAEKPFNILSSSSSPSSTNSLSSYDCNLKLQQSNKTWTATNFEPIKHSPKEYQFWVLENSDDGCESNMKMFIEPKPELLSNPNSSPNSASSSEIMEDTEGLQSFRELNDENMKILCDELEKQVPWQKESIPEIATTILESRSGMIQRKVNNFKNKEKKQESWFFFLGADSKAKETIGRTLGRLIFGSQSNFISIGLSSFSSEKAESSDEFKHKRARNELGCSYIQRFGEAVNENPHRVFFMEDLDQVDYSSQKGIKNAIESGRLELYDGESVPLRDAIVIFSCESFSSLSRSCSPRRSQIACELQEEKDGDDVHEKLKETSPSVSLDLNIAVGDDNGEDSNVQTDGSILECVDRKITFNVQEMSL